MLIPRTQEIINHRGLTQALFTHWVLGSTIPTGLCAIFVDHRVVTRESE